MSSQPPSSKPTKEEISEAVIKLSEVIEKYANLLSEDATLKDLNIIFVVFDNNLFRAYNKGNDLYCASVAREYAKTILRAEEARQAEVNNKEILQ